MKRILAAILLVSGLFLAPWALVFAGSVFFSAVFPWFIEALLAGLLASIIADTDAWKMSAIFVLVVLFQERLKLSLDFNRAYAAYFWLWLAGFFVFAVSFFILI